MLVAEAKAATGSSAQMSPWRFAGGVRSQVQVHMQYTSIYYLFVYISFSLFPCLDDKGPISSTSLQGA